LIVDSAAIIAIAFQEPGHELLVAKMRSASVVGAGAPTLAECGVVLHRRLGDASRGILERLIDEFAVVEIPFGEIHWREAVVAYERFGRGRHPAQLNFGDCMTYAVARLTDQPLLFVGDDFSKTDIDSA
jgi:ribonuclease VapC